MFPKVSIVGRIETNHHHMLHAALRTNEFVVSFLVFRGWFLFFTCCLFPRLVDFTARLKPTTCSFCTIFFGFVGFVE